MGGGCWLPRSHGGRVDVSELQRLLLLWLFCVFSSRWFLQLLFMSGPRLSPRGLSLPEYRGAPRPW
jgi:hypothetical protein